MNYSFIGLGNVTSILSVPKPPDYPPDNPPGVNYYICELKEMSEQVSFGVLIVKGM